VDEKERVVWRQRLFQVPHTGIAKLQGICELCVKHLGVTGAGISMVTGTGNRGIVCATDDTSERIEDLQFTLGEGPCIDAVDSGSPVLVADMIEPYDIAVERWPAFIEDAAKAGVRAVFSFPLRIGAIKVGAMDLYRDQPGDLSRRELAQALAAADASAWALLELEPAREDTFDDDISTRSSFQIQVHQATGMVQSQLNVTTSEAFSLLRARAFASARTLNSVALDVVERRIHFTVEDR
jgi:hypothetical protein